MYLDPSSIRRNLDMVRIGSPTACLTLLSGSIVGTLRSAPVSVWSFVDGNGYLDSRTPHTSPYHIQVERVALWRPHTHSCVVVLLPGDATVEDDVAAKALNSHALFIRRDQSAGWSNILSSNQIKSAPFLPPEAVEGRLPSSACSRGGAAAHLGTPPVPPYVPLRSPSIPASPALSRAIEAPHPVESCPVGGGQRRSLRRSRPCRTRLSGLKSRCGNRMEVRGS